MNWIQLESEGMLDNIKKESANGRILIFKSSPISPISILMRGLFEREWFDAEMDMKAYFLDASGYPGLSRKIESEFGVEQTSPQILILENGKCIYSASLGGIDVKIIRRFSNLRNLK